MSGEVENIEQSVRRTITMSGLVVGNAAMGDITANIQPGDHVQLVAIHPDTGQTAGASFAP